MEKVNGRKSLTLPVYHYTFCSTHESYRLKAKNSLTVTRLPLDKIDISVKLHIIFCKSLTYISITSVLVLIKKTCKGSGGTVPHRAGVKICCA